MWSLKRSLINSYCNACSHLVRINCGHHRCQLIHRIFSRSRNRDWLVRRDWISADHIHSRWRCTRWAFPWLANPHWNRLADRIVRCSHCTNLCIDRRPSADGCGADDDGDDDGWDMHSTTTMMATMCNALVNIFRWQNRWRDKRFAQHTNVLADRCSHSSPTNRDWLVLRVAWEHMVYDVDLDSL